MPYQAFIQHVMTEQSQNDISGLREPGIPRGLSWPWGRGTGAGSIRGPGRCRTLLLLRRTLPTLFSRSLAPLALLEPRSGPHWSRIIRVPSWSSRGLGSPRAGPSWMVLPSGPPRSLAPLAPGAEVGTSLVPDQAGPVLDQSGFGVTPCRPFLDGTSPPGSSPFSPSSSSPSLGILPSFITGGSPVPAPSPGALGYLDEVPPRYAPWRRLVAGSGMSRPPPRLSRPVAASGRHRPIKRRQCYPLCLFS